MAVDSFVVNSFFSSSLRLCAGSVRRKNVSNTLLKNMLDAAIAAITFAVVGYAFAFGGSDPTKGVTFIGTSNFLLTGDDLDYGFWFYQFACSAATVTIIVSLYIISRDPLAPLAAC